jgi:RNA polymerase sigma-70 factor (ECF subfamily)
MTDGVFLCLFQKSEKTSGKRRFRCDYTVKTVMPDSISRVPANPINSEQAIDWITTLRQHDSQLRQTVTAQLIGGHEDAVDDIMQEVAIAATTSKSPPELEEKILPWLRQIARHKIQDHWRKFHRHKRLSEHLEASSPEAQKVLTPFEWVLQVESRNTVSDALSELPEDDRDLLLQKYSQEIPCSEIASASGLSLKSIEYRLSRARNTLRKILNSHNEA